MPSICFTLWADICTWTYIMSHTCNDWIIICLTFGISKKNFRTSNKDFFLAASPQVPPRHHLQVLRGQTTELRRGLRLLPESQTGAGPAGEGGGAQHQDSSRAERTTGAFRLPARPLRRRQEGLRLRKARATLAQVEAYNAAADWVFNAGVSPCRHDEYEGGNSDDEGAQRKKEFSDLFKKQMSMRKVSQGRRSNSRPFLLHICAPAVDRGKV